ncbi:hypothetical protein [Phytohabitans rumicis]|nr:hypothetical protein [Phytohabitans rumicis]
MLRQAGWDLVTMDERYGVTASQSVSDEDWIAEAASRGEVLLCKDLAIARNQLEAEAVFRADARVFALANANITGIAAAECFLAHEVTIWSMARRVPGPYVVSVSTGRLRRCRLNLGRD